VHTNEYREQLFESFVVELDIEEIGQVSSAIVLRDRVEQLLVRRSQMTQNPSDRDDANMRDASAIDSIRHFTVLLLVVDQMSLSLSRVHIDEMLKAHDPFISQLYIVGQQMKFVAQGVQFVYLLFASTRSSSHHICIHLSQ
jgi:hypothetical protein